MLSYFHAICEVISMSPALDKAMAAIPADIAESVMPPPAGSTIEAMRDSRDTHSRDNRDPPCVHCRDPVMSRRRDGRGRLAHLVCQIRIRQRTEADI